MADILSTLAQSLDGPASNGAAAVHGTDFANVSRALYVGTTGDVKVTLAGGGDVTFPTVPAGAWLPVRATKVVISGTTASNIVAVW